MQIIVIGGGGVCITNFNLGGLHNLFYNLGGLLNLFQFGGRGVITYFNLGIVT